MRKITHLLLTSLAITSLGFAYGQNAAPDAKMLGGGTAGGGGFGSIYSPNLFDGSANIVVPIYDFSNEYGSFGISLGYNTKGVKVDQTETPAGLNWNIAAQPEIVRILKDIPDEANGVDDEYIWAGEDEWKNTNRYVRGKFVTYTETAAQAAQDSVYRDGECDDFIVTLGGSTFTFNLGKNKNIFTNPHRNIQLTVFINGIAVPGVTGDLIATEAYNLNTWNLTFRIKDEQGTIYDFVPIENQQQFLYTDPFFSENASMEANPTIRWGVSKITFANGSVITYNYSDKISRRPDDQYMQYSVHEWFDAATGTSSGPIDMGGPAGVKGQGQFAQLQSIVYPNGVTATLSYSTTDKTTSMVPMLKEINISTGSSNCQRYMLRQSKVNSRWYLDSVRMVSCGGNDEPYYSFVYDDIQLPARFNPGQDFFGYFNNDSVAVNFTTTNPEKDRQKKMMIPKHAPLTYGATRSYNAAYAKAGLIKKVTTAYGGSTTFYYGPHTGLTNPITSITALAGVFFADPLAPDGVRVDSTIETDIYHPENNKVTKYTYSNGKIFMPGGHFYSPIIVDSVTGAYKKLAFQNMYLTPHQMPGGSNHGYSNVSIRTYSGGLQLSRRDMVFSNITDAGVSGNRYYKVSGSKHYFEFPFTDKQYLKDWELGLPLEITDYDENDRIVQKTLNTYTFEQDLSASSYISNTKKVRVNSGTAVAIPSTLEIWYPYKRQFTDAYYPYTGYALLGTTKVQKYVSDTRFVADSSNFYYDSRKNLKSAWTRNSEGQTIKTVQVYNYDTKGTTLEGGAAVGSVLYNMTADGLEKIVGTERWLRNADADPIYSDVLLDASVTGYSYSGGKLLTQKQWILRNGHPDYAAYTGLTSGTSVGNPYRKLIRLYAGNAEPLFQVSSEVLLRDSKSNPLESQLVGQDIYKTMLWDTISGRKLAEAGNCRFAQMAYTSFERTAANINYSTANVLTGTGAISGDRIYQLNSGTNINGTQNLSTTQEYLLRYWAKGGAPVVSIEGSSSSSSVITSSVYTLGSTGWKQYEARFKPTITGKFRIASPGAGTIYLDEISLVPATAVIQSWTYDPLFGATSSTDATGRITYYEYDGQGRVQLTRDQEGNILGKTEYTVQGAE